MDANRQSTRQTRADQANVGRLGTPNTPKPPREFKFLWSSEMNLDATMASENCWLNCME